MNIDILYTKSYNKVRKIIRETVGGAVVRKEPPNPHFSPPNYTKYAFCIIGPTAKIRPQSEIPLPRSCRSGIVNSQIPMIQEVPVLLALDIGNSSITVGVFRLNTADEIPSPICRFQISARAGFTSDEYVMLIRDYLEHAQIGVCGSHPDSRDTVDAAVISSVVPGLTHVLTKAASALTGSEPFLITPGIHTGFGIRIKDPAQLGSDIVANAAASLRMIEPPFVILDMGTATTLTAADVSGDIIGTIILPGLRLSMDALTGSAALLSGVALEKPDELIGRDSRTAILSGVIGGHILMIDGFLRSIREEMQLKESGIRLGLISTGGLAETVIPHTRNRFRHEPSLTLIGAAELYRKNKQRK